MNKLAEKTLVTKGTLTGIVDRLEKRGLVRREVPEGDRRSFIIMLTPQGHEVFEHVFHAHIAHLKQCFEGLSPDELAAIQAALEQLRGLFADDRRAR